MEGIRAAVAGDLAKNANKTVGAVMDPFNPKASSLAPGLMDQPQQKGATAALNVVQDASTPHPPLLKGGASVAPSTSKADPPKLKGATVAPGLPQPMSESDRKKPQSNLKQDQPTATTTISSGRCYTCRVLRLKVGLMLEPAYRSYSNCSFKERISGTTLLLN